MNFWGDLEGLIFLDCSRFQSKVFTVDESGSSSFIEKLKRRGSYWGYESSLEGPDVGKILWLGKRDLSDMMRILMGHFTFNLHLSNMWSRLCLACMDNYGILDHFLYFWTDLAGIIARQGRIQGCLENGNPNGSFNSKVASLKNVKRSLQGLFGELWDPRTTLMFLYGLSVYHWEALFTGTNA